MHFLQEKHRSHTPAVARSEFLYFIFKEFILFHFLFLFLFFFSVKQTRSWHNRVPKGIEILLSKEEKEERERDRERERERGGLVGGGITNYNFIDIRVSLMHKQKCCQ